MIGTGAITSQFIQAVENEKRTRAYAIYSRKMETALAFKEQHNLDVCYDNLTTMLNDQNIDVIYIASPNSLHFKHAVKAIKSGKHCLIEKPIALKLSEIKELYKLAKEHNVYIQEAYVSLVYNTFKTIFTWICELGEIGKVDFHLAQQTRHFENYLQGQDINVFNGKMGGGAMRDLGPYTLFPLVSWFGAPMQTHYFSTKNETGADETTLALCHYETFSATIYVSKMLSDKRASIISGDNGYIEIDHINEMSLISFYDPKGKLLKQETASYKHRMSPELIHFIDIISSNTYVSHLYTEQLSLDVHSIIIENYK